MALAPLLGANPVITAGAVISGAYFGDKMTPISETTVLVPSMVGGVTTQRAHRRDDLDVRAGGHASRSSASRSSASSAPPAGDRRSTRPQAQATLAGEFWISPLNLLPLVLLIILSLRRAPPFLSIFGCALFAGVLAWFTQPRSSRRSSTGRMPGRS